MGCYAHAECTPTQMASCILNQPAHYHSHETKLVFITEPQNTNEFWPRLGKRKASNEYYFENESDLDDFVVYDNTSMLDNEVQLPNKFEQDVNKNGEQKEIDKTKKREYYHDENLKMKKTGNLNLQDEFNLDLSPRRSSHILAVSNSNKNLIFWKWVYF